MFQIDLNSDLGESFGSYKLGLDDEVLAFVTSANVACGWHAGDPLVMDRTVALAADRGVFVGAHPGFPDLLGACGNPVGQKIDARFLDDYPLAALLHGHPIEVVSAQRQR